jgi:signal transduction histidine kinase
MTAARSTDGAAGRLPFWRRLPPARARFWGVLVPIHVAAFAVLYGGTLQLLERAYSQAGATAARFQLDQAVRAVPFSTSAALAGRNPHVFDHLMALHQPIGLRLYGRDAAPLGAMNLSIDAAETRRVRDFLAQGDAMSQSWVEEENGRRWVRGVVRLTADAGCTSCHAAGETLGAATMKVDFTAELVEIHRQLGRRTALLLAAWITLIAIVTMVVQRTVRRSADRLHAALADVSAGRSTAEAGALALPLDPVSAEVHRSLHDFLRRHREREAQVATRLAHVDQLASLGQLAAGLAHEIKNPLAGIQGALELLRDEAKDEATVRLHDDMLGELKRVHGILQRLLESGRPAPLRLARTQVARLAADTADLLRPSLRRKRVELRVEFPDDLPEILVDPAKMRQVLVNLVQNAAEAMPESGGTVSVMGGAFPAEGAIVLTVKDDGPGIPAEQMQQLFEPFFTTKFSGTGLGLTISKSLVEQHGGRIEVSSEVGRGTSFLIILPVGPAATQTAAESEAR